MSNWQSNLKMQKLLEIPLKFLMTQNLKWPEEDKYLTLACVARLSPSCYTSGFPITTFKHE